MSLAHSRFKSRRYMVASVDEKTASLLWGEGIIYRVAAIDGLATCILWEGESYVEAQNEVARLSVEARARGSTATIALDCFRMEVEKTWIGRPFASRPPSAPNTIRHHPGKHGRPKILFMPMEFPSWANGAHSWSYAASLAYEAGLHAAGCDVTTINTATSPHQRKILRGRKFDQVWFHCHPLHLDDFVFRQWISEIAPVRLMLCGETMHNPEPELMAAPWLTSLGEIYSRWAPHVTHAAFVDPADVGKSTIRRSSWWRQAIPERFVMPVNVSPNRNTAVFVGTLYPPRDTWAMKLDGVMERVESPESGLFQLAFERSHQWIRQTLNAIPDVAGLGPGPTPRYWHAWKVDLAMAAYNHSQRFLRKRAFRNFLKAIRDSVAVVNLPSHLKAYSGRVVEGMASGRPVITSRITGHDIFADDELVHYESVEELKDQILRMRSSPIEANRIAQRARAAIMAKHTVEVRAAELLRFAEDAA